jgi:transcriptional regulator GlxA family with amidase domain
LVIAGHIVTCTGRASALDAALVVARSSGGSELVDHIVTELAEAREEAARAASKRRRRHRRRVAAPRVPMGDITIGDAQIVMLELEEIAPRERR